jgi:hypothetical protein
VTGEIIEDSLTVAPRDEWILFCNRDKFDLIVMYDDASETPGPADAPLAKLIWAILAPIYETASRKIPKHMPVLLIGGLKAWKREFGAQELVIEQAHCDERASYVLWLQLLLTVRAGRVTINILPDDVLLHIFHSVRVTSLDGLKGVDGQYLPWNWHRLVHVCRRWRSVVFASPKFLDLKLLCGLRTRVQHTGIWPPLPIVIRNNPYFPHTAIVQPNRICEISLRFLKSSQFQRLISTMQHQFPALVHLTLDFVYNGGPTPSLPDGFLGGSTPRLQSLTLRSIAFPALPKLLLSATDLVQLTFSNIPHFGYVSPEAIVAGLAVLANLKSLTIGFEPPLSRPDGESQRPTPATPIVLPALTYFEFQGSSEYLEDLVGGIDAPLLDSTLISTHQLILDVPQLAQFIGHRTWFQELNEAHVDLDSHSVQVKVSSPTRTFDRIFRLRITCEQPDWQLSSVRKVFTSFFPSIYTVRHLYIHCAQNFALQWQADVENMPLLEVFYPFTSVKNLYVSKEGAQRIATALALQALVGERATEVFPALESLYLEELPPLGPIQEAIGQFFAARQLSGHPVAISHWNRT